MSRNTHWVVTLTLQYHALPFPALRQPDHRTASDRSRVRSRNPLLDEDALQPLKRESGVASIDPDLGRLTAEQPDFTVVVQHRHNWVGLPVLLREI